MKGGVDEGSPDPQRSSAGWEVIWRTCLQIELMAPNSRVSRLGYSVFNCRTHRRRTVESLESSTKSMMVLVVMTSLWRVVTCDDDDVTMAIYACRQCQCQCCWLRNTDLTDDVPGSGTAMTYLMTCDDVRWWLPGYGYSYWWLWHYAEALATLDETLGTANWCYCQLVYGWRTYDVRVTLWRDTEW